MRSLSPTRFAGVFLGVVAACVLVLIVASSLISGVSFLMGMGGSTGCQQGQNQAGSAACVPPSSPVAAAIVQLALVMGQHMQLNAACHGVPSAPDCYDTWYDAGFPPEVIAYGQKVCPGCSEWANGNFQCVSFVVGAYSQAAPLPASGNAIDYWSLYRNRPGWIEVPSAAAPAGLRGSPAPGDIAVWAHPPDGHVAIVTHVVLPTASADGSITVDQANSPTATYTMALHPDLSITTWPGYAVLGFIRPLTALANASQRLVRISQLDPAQYASPGQYNTWAYSACSTASMTEVLNAYGHAYRIADVLAVEAGLGEITPQLGLVEEGGIAKTVSHFGFTTFWGHQLSLDQVIATANAGQPVIVGFPPDRYAGGHLLVVTGGNASVVRVADSSAWDRTAIPRGQFLAWWGGFSAIVVPKVAGGAPPGSSYAAIAQADAVSAGIPPLLFLRQINVESGFNPNALSKAGAEGIAQLMPATAAGLGIDPWDPIAALLAAAHLMAGYTLRWHGDYAKALATYNAGLGTLEGALARCGSAWLRCVPPETQVYIHAIMA